MKRKMRISSGKKRGMALKDNRPSSLLRPLTGKLKNAIFSILFDRVINAEILDMFAGTGIFGFEALSRGAGHVTFVDKSYQYIRLIRENAQKLQFDKRIELISRDFKDAIEFLNQREKSFSLIFIDPPYNTDFACRTLTHPSFMSLLRHDSLVIVRVHHKTELPDSINNLSVVDKRKYGEAKVYFYKLAQ